MESLGNIARPTMRSSAIEQDILCESCEVVVFGKQTWISIWSTSSSSSSDTVSISHPFTRQQLHASVKGGCRFCQFLLSNVPTETYGEVLQVAISLSTPEGVKPRKINHAVVHVTGLPQYATRLLHISVFAKPRSIASTMVRAVEDPDALKRNFDPVLARSWIENCGSRHTSETCHNVPKRLPTRVLDVSSLGSGLIPLKTMPSKMDQYYAVLSYCWGKSKPLMTTKASLDSHREGLQLQKMPKTYRDAVFITSKLKIRYLWIDALCIVQDCDRDKLSELSRMGSYYENAHVMIAASSAHSSDDGFLSPDMLLEPNPAVASLDHRLEQKSRCFGIPCYTFSGLQDTIYLDTAPKEYQANGEPLNKRAWTYQEWLLCRRALVFPSTGGFFLHCNEEKRHDDSIDFGAPFGASRMFSPPSVMSMPQDSDESSQ